MAGKIEHGILHLSEFLRKEADNLGRLAKRTRETPPQRPVKLRMRKIQWFRFASLFYVFYSSVKIILKKYLFRIFSFQELGVT